MRTSGAGLFPLLVLAVLAAATFWLEQASQSEPAGPRAKDRHDPDFWVDTVKAHGFDAKGTAQHELHAARIEHYPDDDTTLAFEPRLKYLENKQLAISAKQAWVEKQGEQIRLEGDVRVVQPGGPGRSDTVATTSRMNVLPNEEKADTDAPVTIRRGSSVIRGEGGIAIDNKSQVIVLFGPATATIYRNAQ